MSKSAWEKTQDLGRTMLPVSSLVPNPNNPNEMDDAAFNLLCDNFEKTGMTDPVFVRKLENGKYRVIGGHHRLEVAKLYDWQEVPCTIIDDPDFDEDAENFQVVRMNMIRGKMSPEKFMKMYQSLNNKYTAEIAAESFGFVKQEEFDKLVTSMSKTLPQEMQKDFKKAAEEVKTIDGLSKLLNSMFTRYGNTLPYDYMMLDFGGRDTVWIRMHGSDKKHLLAMGAGCMKAGVTLDSVLMEMVKKVVGDATLMQQLTAKGTTAVFEPGTEWPTEETLNAATPTVPAEV